MQSCNIKQKRTEAGIDHGYSPNHGTAGLCVENSPMHNWQRCTEPNHIVTLGEDHRYD
jgi:hypothetical protein